MIYVFLSVCCSVIVSVMLKLGRRYNIDAFQAITWNYSTAILLTCIVYKPHLTFLPAQPVYLYSILGVLLPVLFVIMAAAVKQTGIVRTDVAQRLSLFIPLIASFLLFSETSSPLKFIGIAIGLAAIICSIPWKKDTAHKISGNSWIYLLLVFLGFGVIDILFKQMATFTGVPFTASLLIVYVLAFSLSLVALLYMVITKKIKFSIRHIFFGWILGIFNFGNILFYLKAHQKLASNPSAVFSAMNIGVITLGTLTGLIIFKEKLTLVNKIGIALAVAAIILITISQQP